MLLPSLARLVPGSELLQGGLLAWTGVDSPATVDGGRLLVDISSLEPPGL